GPRELARIVEATAAGRDEELRDLLAVEDFLDGGVGRRADGAIDEQDSVTLDQLPGHLDRLWRAVAIVERDEPDLAPVDAAFLVHCIEVRDAGVARGGGRRDRSA